MLCVVDAVYGLTVLDNAMYVLSPGSSIIKMYTADTLSPLGKSIHVEGMRNPRDIVACRRDRQLYVADDWNSIWRVSADDHSYAKWLPTASTVEIFRVDTMSLTSTAGYVTVSLSETVQHGRETTGARRSNATVRGRAVSRR